MGDNLTQEQIQKLRQLALKFKVENLDSGEYWDLGNMDDCYQVGVSVGEANVLQDLVDILES